jgi:hypothetical protein
MALVSFFFTISFVAWFNLVFHVSLQLLRIGGSHQAILFTPIPFVILYRPAPTICVTYSSSPEVTMYFFIP